MNSPDKVKPEDCPEPFWHDTHEYCPSCMWHRGIEEEPVNKDTVPVNPSGEMKDVSHLLEPIHYPPLSEYEELDFSDLRIMNAARRDDWHGDAEWNIVDWAISMGGESGEALNIVKKLRRHEVGLGDSWNTPEKDALLEKLAGELADIICYTDLLADHCGIDLGKAVRDKFNSVSRQQGLSHRI